MDFIKQCIAEYGSPVGGIISFCGVVIILVGIILRYITGTRGENSYDVYRIHMILTIGFNIMLIGLMGTLWGVEQMLLFGAIAIWIWILP